MRGDYITKLPNEVLLLCFEQVVVKAVPNFRKRLFYDVESEAICRSLNPLALTCKRFYRLSQSLQYSQVELYPHDPARMPQKGHWHVVATSSAQLERTLESNPDLRLYCEFLSANFSLNVPQGLSDVVSVVERFPNVKKLILGGPQEKHNDDDQQSTQTRGQKSPEHDEDKSLLPPVSHVVMAGRGAILKTRKEKEGTARFTHLLVSGFSHGNPLDLRNFLKWPGGLQVFHLHSVAMGDYDWESLFSMHCNSYEWTYGLLRTVLLLQKNSLRELVIQQMGPQTGFNEFDLQDFSALEHLEICCSGLFRSVTPEQACRMWATASLKTLVLQCSHEDSQHGTVWYFRENHAKWVQQFASLTASAKQKDGAALNEIRLVYDPFDIYDEERDPEKIESEVWNRINGVLESVRVAGFIATHVM